MFNYLRQQKGFALVGIIIAVVIIAALAYSSSSFVRQKSGEFGRIVQPGVQEQLGGIKKQVEGSNRLKQEMMEETADPPSHKATEGEGQTTGPIDVSSSAEAMDDKEATVGEDWQTYRNEEHGFIFEYPSKFGEIEEKKYTIVPPAGKKGEGIVWEFSKEDSFWVTVFFPEEYKELDQRCDTKGIDKEALYYCKDVTVGGQDTYYSIELKYIPECGGAEMIQEIGLPIEKDSLKGTIMFRRLFSEINQTLEPFFDCQDDSELEEVAYSYLVKLYRNDATEPATKLVEQFNQIISTFKFIDKDKTDLSTEGWRIYEKPKKNVRLKYHKDWYYDRDEQAEKELGYDLYVGFGESPEVLAKGRPYPIDFMIVAKDHKFPPYYSGYIKTITTRDDKKFVLRTGDQIKYKDILDTMAGSFEFIDK